MGGDRSRYGLLLSAFGALLLVGSTFLPWYEIASTIHAAGAAAAPAGQRVGVVTTHRSLNEVSIVLLVLAALAILDALAPLARSGGPLPGGAGGSVALLGAVAGAFVIYRMLVAPAPAGWAVEHLPREGAWLALLGSLAIALGGVRPRGVGVAASASPPSASHASASQPSAAPQRLHGRSSAGEAGASATR